MSNARIGIGSRSWCCREVKGFDKDGGAIRRLVTRRHVPLRPHMQGKHQGALTPDQQPCGRLVLPPLIMGRHKPRFIEHPISTTTFCSFLAVLCPQQLFSPDIVERTGYCVTRCRPEVEAEEIQTRMQTRNDGCGKRSKTRRKKSTAWL